LPVAEVDENIELAQMAEHSATTAPHKKSHASLILIAGVAFVATAGGVTWWLSQRQHRPHQEEAAAVPVEPAPAPAPAATATAPAPAQEPAPTPPPPPVEAPAPTGVMLQIDSVPPGAAITIDGKPRGVTPLQVKLYEPRTVKLALALAGYVSVKQELAIDHDQRVLIPLAPKPKAAVAKPAAKKKDPKKKDPKDPFQRFD
ncbi:MAG TPA: PEGA domain-containing protein, partial [Kofleriaceae bacterium]|nr:PEGA domain-containing protein [Kofleriaceae bacterium]